MVYQGEFHYRDFQGSTDTHTCRKAGKTKRSKLHFINILVNMNVPNIYKFLKYHHNFYVNCRNECRYLINKTYKQYLQLATVTTEHIHHSCF